MEPGPHLTDAGTRAPLYIVQCIQQYEASICIFTHNAVHILISLSILICAD